MSCTFFISDLHLSEQRPDIFQNFSYFMQQIAPEGEALYVLGDLFDFWVGDDETSSLIEETQLLFLALKQKNIPCFFVRGNRDFLVGEKFAASCGMTLLPDYFSFDLYGNKTLLCHGDTLCIDDEKYQRFRQKVHKPWLQALFLALPLSVRLKVAQKIRTKSGKEKTKKNFDVMDVNQDFVKKIMKAYESLQLIHGHTHREAFHFFNEGKRIVLGDWGREKNPVSILKVECSGEMTFIHWIK